MGARQGHYNNHLLLFAFLASMLYLQNNFYYYNIHVLHVGSKARAAIFEAIEEFTRKSCIRFVKRNSKNYRSYQNYVQFISGRG